MPVPFLLLDVLENLSTKELKSFKWFLGLKILKCCDPILTSYLESPLRQNTVSRMIQSYGEENAVNMTLAILRLMKLNNAAEDLQKSHAEETAAEGKVSRPPISSPASRLATGRKISADGAAGATAPKAPIAPDSRVHFGGIIDNGTGGNTGGTSGGNGNVGRDVGRNVAASGNVGGKVRGNSNVTISGNVCSNIGSNVGRAVDQNVGGNAGDMFDSIFYLFFGHEVGGNSNVTITGNADSNIGSNVRSNVGRDVAASGNVGGKVGGNSNVTIMVMLTVILAAMLAATLAAMLAAMLAELGAKTLPLAVKLEVIM
ncbi:Caspase b [Dissostichus eleginoides]|uniref:Caspase b n=1 Tax=Dissostichus eleginoides TaxID=100907 RepID=A0AAD9BNM7_DISEL|nr:Caspase b [Dissostichus eleginoides]